MCHAGVMSDPKKCKSELTKLKFTCRAKKINTDTETTKQTNALVQHSKYRPGVRLTKTTATKRRKRLSGVRGIRSSTGGI